MIVFRLSKKEYRDDLSGRGAEKVGGRWNNKGVSMLYTSDSRALCNSEIAAHIPLGNIPTDYFLISIEIPDSIKIQEIKISKLPKGWKKFPYLSSTKFIGDNFVKKKRYSILKSPSAVVQGDFNYLINPNHKDFGKIKIIKTEPFKFDKRLFKK